MYPQNFIESINDRVTSYVAKFDEFLPEDLGLDERAAYRLYVDKDRTCIAIEKRNDRPLQYYGGFEYVDKEYRQECGNWVFYLATDDRVDSCLLRLEEVDAN